MTAPARSERTTSGCLVLSVLVIWVPVTLVFDAVVGYGLWNQCRAWGFATTPGTVTASRAKGTGDTTELDVRYRYTVDGREFVGDRYCFGLWGTNDGTWERAAAALPPGAEVTVSYNPADPGESTLTRGPQGMHLFMANFLVPFNLVTAGLVASRLCRRWDVTEGSKAFTARWGCGAFAVVWGLVALAGVFVLVGVGGFNPPVWAASIPWVVGPGLGLAAFATVIWLVRRADRSARPPDGSSRSGGGIP
jgi:hypothetical protein